MNKNKKILIAAGLAIGIVVLIVGTAFLLKNVDTNKPTANVPSQDQESPETIYEKENNINHEANEKAKAIEKEATALIESDPPKAKQKFIEAQTAYKEAGNSSKEAEMRDNAATAETVILPEPPDPGPGLESGGNPT
jgi:hypothetical protein